MTQEGLADDAGFEAGQGGRRGSSATASFTLDVYGWVLPGMQAEAAAVFSRLMAAPADNEGPVDNPMTGPT